MGDVTFNEIPQGLEDPQTVIEVDSSRAALGSFSREIRGLIIGVRLAAGTVAEAVPTQFSTVEDAETYWGVGSQMAQMAKRAMQKNPNIEWWGCALDEAAGTAATLTMLLGGTATEDGSLECVIDDEIVVPVPVLTGEDETVVGPNIVTAVTNALYNRRIVTPTFSIATLTWTYRHKGTMGNGHRIEIRNLPAGLTNGTPIGYLSAGATDPDMDTATAALGGQRYTHIATGLNDTTNLGKLADTFLAGRWAYNVKQWGLCFCAVNDTQGNTTTAGNAENSPYMLMLGPGKAQKPEHCWAAEMAAIAAKVYSVDPAKDPLNQPFGGTYVAPSTSDIFTGTERNTLNTDGVATVKYERGSAKVARAAMTYQTNAAGTPDKAYHDLVDVQNLMASLEELEQLATPFQGWKLAPNGTAIPAGAEVMTPNGMAGLILSWYKQREGTRFIDYEGFKKELISQINSLDQNRLDLVIPERLIPHLYITAMKVSFIRGIPFGQE